jgi:two-component sensor histidine kinase
MRWRDQFDLPGRLSGRVPVWVIELAVALAITLMTTGLRWAAGLVLPGMAEFPLAFPGVAVATLLAGPRAGLVVIGLYQLYVSIGIDGARYTIFTQSPAAAVSVLLIMASQAMIVWIVASYRRYAQRILALEREHAVELQRSKAALARQIDLEEQLRTQNHELRRTKHSLEAIYESSGEGLVLCEAISDADGHLTDYRVLQVNRAHGVLTGIDAARLHSATARTAIHDLDERLLSTADRALETGDLQQFDLYVDATQRWVNIRVARVANGLFLQTFVDVTDRHRLDEQRQSLIKEMSHRVLNNFQMITSFLQLQAMGASPDVRQQLGLATSRIQVIAKLHTLLAYSASDTEIDGGTYLKELCSYLTETIDRPDAIRIACDCPMVLLPTDTVVSLGLITSELVMNAIKYAFPPPATGTISLTLSTDHGRVTLVIEDDGDGFTPAPDTTAQDDERGGLGMRLVHIFVRQIHATLTTSSGKGVRHVLEFAC